MAEIELTQLKIPHEDNDSALREDIRSDLEDSLKEYSEIDLLVELLQNALDAMDERRYRSICAKLAIDSSHPSSIAGWNKTVDDLIQSDYEAFPDRSSGVSPQAVWQASAASIEPRRRRWAEVLIANLGLEPNAIEQVVNLPTSWAQLSIDLDLSNPYQLTVVDSGTGISDPLMAFRHKGSTKRRQDERRRRGIRGSHGWGLSAILGLCDRVEVVTKVSGTEPKGLKFENFASFRADPSVTPVIRSFEASDVGSLGLPELSGESGTAIRVALPAVQPDGLLQKLISEGSAEQWSNSLRLYTPIGQVNDYVLHPAYHCLRRTDIKITLRLKRGPDLTTVSVPYDYLRLSYLRSELCQDLKQFVDSGMQPGKSVYCVGREKSGNNIYLIAAEIQASKPTMATIEDRSANRLVNHLTESGEEAPLIPRGIYLALSGGMKSESVALPPLSTNAAYRGIVLAETARATLGRRHTMDQRTSIPKAAKDFARTYDAVRKKTIPAGQPILTGPALHKWQRKLWRNVIAELSQDPPFTNMLVWAASGSGEARVMLTFGELLGARHFGEMRVLRCSLRDRYDFQFSYRWGINEDLAPSGPFSETLINQGFAARVDGGYRRLAIGEFKSQGDSILGELDASATDWRKNPNSIDWLVCWDFDESVLGEAWTSAPIDGNPELREFRGQTHIWVPAPGNARNRPLAVTAMRGLLVQLMQAEELAAVEDWAEVIGSNYYDEDD